MKEITLSGVATKQDIADVREEIRDLREEMVKGFSDSLKFQLIQTVALMAVMVTLFQVYG